MIETWRDLEFWSSPDWKEIQDLLPECANGQEWAPKHQDVFRPFILTPLKKTKVVILGSEPYHQPGLADGLCYSTREPEMPRAFRNIISELRNDLSLTGTPYNNSLAMWARQGVLLLNASLTVQIGMPGSHMKFGWDQLIAEVLDAVAIRNTGAVFILWGPTAQRLAEDACISQNYMTIESTEPTTVFSSNNPFFGSRPFSQTNRYLKETSQKAIQWRLPGMN